MFNDDRTPPPTGDNVAPPQGGQFGGVPDVRSISLTFNGSGGQSVAFKLKSTTKLGKAMNHYSARLEQPVGQLRFLFDGARLHPDDTPESLQMEDSDIVDVHMEQIGGGDDVATPTSEGEHLQDWVDTANNVNLSEDSSIEASTQTSTTEVSSVAGNLEQLALERIGLFQDQIARIEAIEAAFAKLSHDHDEITRDARRNRHDLEIQANNFAAIITVLRHENLILTDENNVLAGSNAALTMRTDTLTTNVHEFIEDNEQLVEDNDELHDNVEELQSEVEHFEVSFLNEKSHHQQVSRINARLEGTNRELKNAVTGYRLANDQLTNAVTDLKADKFQLTQENKAIRDYNNFLVDANTGHMKKHNQLVQSINTVKAENAEIKIENRDLAMKNMTLRADASQFTKIAGDLKAQGDQLAAEGVQSAAYNQHLNSINVDLKGKNEELTNENQKLKVHNQEMLVEVTMRLAEIQMLSKNTTGLKATVKTLSKEKLALKQMFSKNC